MDVKMDSGYLGPGENHAQALEDDYDVTRELAPDEVVGIMDDLLCHEVGVVLSCKAVTDIPRWRGIWDIRFRKPSSHPYISTSYYGPYRITSMTPVSIVETHLINREARRWYISF